MCASVGRRHQLQVRGLRRFCTAETRLTSRGEVNRVISVTDRYHDVRLPGLVYSDRAEDLVGVVADVRDRIVRARPCEVRGPRVAAVPRDGDPRLREWTDL